MQDEEFTASVAGIAALADPVRRALYLFVTTAGDPVTRDQAAAGVEVPRHTAKFHLDRLVDDGLLETAYRRVSGRRGPGAGRPAKVYRRAARSFAVSLPARRYDLAGHVLADAVEAAAGSGVPVRDAVDAAAAAAGRRLAEPQLPLDDVLTSLGYEPRTAGDGVVLGNCPFAALATGHTALVCGMNVRLLGALLDERGEGGVRAELRPAPGGCCVALVPAPAGSP